MKPSMSKRGVATPRRSIGEQGVRGALLHNRCPGAPIVVGPGSQARG